MKKVTNYLPGIDCRGIGFCQHFGNRSDLTRLWSKECSREGKGILPVSGPRISAKNTLG